MEVHQLRYLVAIVDEGSFTAAAHRLHVSQSGVSTQLAKLERELGQQLFDRTSRTIALTPAGKAILPMARESLAALDAMPHTAAEFADAVRGPVRLGAIHGCTIPGFLDVVAGLGKTHPGITLSLTEDNARTLQARVLDRTLDLALIAYAGTVDPELELHVISEEPLVAVTDVGFPRGEVRLVELQDSPVLCLVAGSGVRTAYEGSCAQAGIEARTDFEATSLQTLIGLAARGAGTAVIPISTAPAEGVTITPIPDATVPASLGLVSRPNEPSPAVRLVRDKLQAALPREEQS
jgi:DNA-binding transcriptional LysR family regulator